MRDDLARPDPAPPHRFPLLEDPDPEVRRDRLWKARTLGGAATDPLLYAHALRVFCLDADAKCRESAIWIMRDAWKTDRALRDAPLDAALIATAVGHPRRFWAAVATRLKDPEVRRTVAPGEHLQWIARQSDDPLIGALAAEPAVAFRLVDGALEAAQDTEVRTYPRAAFTQLAGRVAHAVPDTASQVITGCLRVLESTPVYDIRYWAERVLDELGDDGDE